MLDTTPNQLSKFRTKILIKIDNGSFTTYNTNNQIKVRNVIWKSSSWDFGDTCILAKDTITITGGPESAMIVHHLLSP